MPDHTAIVSGPISCDQSRLSQLCPWSLLCIVPDLVSACSQAGYFAQCPDLGFNDWIIELEYVIFGIIL